MRDSYKSLYEFITRDILKEEFDLAAGLITGVPGIGKTIFLLYFIYRFISDERFSSKSFAVQLRYKEYILFTPNSSGTYMMQVKEAADIVNEILLLTDLKENQFSMENGIWFLVHLTLTVIRRQ